MVLIRQGFEKTRFAWLGRTGALTCNHCWQETEGGTLDRCSADKQVWVSNSPSKTLGQPRGASAVRSFSEAVVLSMSRILFGVGKTRNIPLQMCPKITFQGRGQVVSDLKNYRQRRNAEVRRRSSPGKNTPTGYPMLNGQLQKHVHERNIICIEQVVFMYLEIDR